MGIAIVCVGKLRESYFAAAAAEYQKRLSRLAALEICEVPDLPESEHSSPALHRKLRESEGARILQKLKPGDQVVALCLEGKQMTSEQLAARVAAWNLAGGRLACVIGGSLGLGDNVLARANERLSFSPMTFPHQLARVMLLEQLYRAHKINAGERYHK